MQPETDNFNRSRKSHLRTATFMAAVFLPILGCSLSEYEAKMEFQQKRIANFDEENQYLAGPIDLPQKKKAPAAKQAGPAPAVFFRPPKGISSKCEQIALPKDLLCRFPKTVVATSGGPRGLPGPGSANREKTFDFEDLFVSANPDRNPNFINDILQYFGAGELKPKRVMITPFGSTPLPFDYWVFNSPPLTSFLYVYQGSPFPVALIYRMQSDMAKDQGKFADMQKAMDFSVKSLAVGPAATQKLKTFQSGKPPAAAPPGAAPPFGGPPGGASR